MELERIRGAVRRGLFGKSDATKVGRYTLLKVLGAGGSGRVYAAYDPELDRKVALKILRDPLGDESERARLLREAQAGARFSDRNVIHVYDVGVHQGLVYVAMEYVEGSTLARFFLRERGFDPLLDVFLKAGAGLAAAHRSGLIHRDFKPENVLVGDDGRVCVVDFGLARSTEPAVASESILAARDAEPDAQQLVDAPLTETGVILGTPAYMSPEQHRGDAADARSDQFSFAVSLWEYVYRQHPFGDQSGEARRQAILHGELQPIPTDRAAPKWLANILEQALSGDPGDRFESMDALLGEIEARRRRPERSRGKLVGAAIVLLGVAGLGVVLARPRDRAACRDVDERLEGVWDDSRRADLADAFSTSGHGWDDVDVAASHWVDRWTVVYTEHCQQMTTQPDRPEHLERLACLGRQLQSFDEAMRGLERGSAQGPETGVLRVESLGAPDDC
jgi:hypothetical protein